MELLADIIRIIHYLVVLFVLTAHSLIPIEYIKYYLIFIILIFLDWNDMDGQCILTRLEFYFRTGKWNQGSPVEGGPEFFRPIINKITKFFGSKKEITPIEGDRLNNFIFIICWGIAFLRIYHKL